MTSGLRLHYQRLIILLTPLYVLSRSTLTSSRLLVTSGLRPYCQQLIILLTPPNGLPRSTLASSSLLVTLGLDRTRM